MPRNHPPDAGDALAALAQLHALDDQAAARHLGARLDRWFAGSTALGDRPTLAELQDGGYVVAESAVLDDLGDEIVRLEAGR